MFDTNTTFIATIDPQQEYNDFVYYVVEETVGYIVTVLIVIKMMPQLIKVYKKRRTYDLSLGFLILGIFGAAFAITYGVLIDKTPVIVRATFTFVQTSLILGGKIYFDGKHTKEIKELELAVKNANNDNNIIFHSEKLKAFQIYTFTQLKQLEKKLKDKTKEIKADIENICDSELIILIDRIKKDFNLIKEEITNELLDVDSDDSTDI